MSIQLIEGKVKLKDGRIGNVVGCFADGNYMLQSRKGGQITYFKKTDVVENFVKSTQKINN